MQLLHFPFISSSLLGSLSSSSSSPFSSTDSPSSSSSSGGGCSVAQRSSHSHESEDICLSFSFLFPRLFLLLFSSPSLFIFTLETFFLHFFSTCLPDVLGSAAAEGAVHPEHLSSHWRKVGQCCSSTSCRFCARMCPGVDLCDFLEILI